MNLKLSPTDLTFLYEGCKRCFYFKTLHNISQPSIQLPSIFTKIAGLLKTHYTGRRTSDLHVVLPPGVINYGEKYVTSEIIRVPDRAHTCYINGRFDITISFDDGTYGVYDFKTGDPESQSTNLYGRQLHAYAYALEHSAGRLSLSPISKLGLLYFYPTGITQTSPDRLSYDADVTLIEIQKDEQKFIRFISEVLGIFEFSRPPESSPDCKWCNYLTKHRSIGGTV
jgi:hypothetical protein